MNIPKGQKNRIADQRLVPNEPLKLRLPKTVAAARKGARTIATLCEGVGLAPIPLDHIFEALRYGVDDDKLTELVERLAISPVTDVLLKVRELSQELERKEEPERFAAYGRQITAGSNAEHVVTNLGILLDEEVQALIKAYGDLQGGYALMGECLENCQRNSVRAREYQKDYEELERALASLVAQTETVLAQSPRSILCDQGSIERRYGEVEKLTNDLEEAERHLKATQLVYDQASNQFWSCHKTIREIEQTWRDKARWVQRLDTLLFQADLDLFALAGHNRAAALVSWANPSSATDRQWETPAEFPQVKFKKTGEYAKALLVRLLGEIAVPLPTPPHAPQPVYQPRQAHPLHLLECTLVVVREAKKESLQALATVEIHQLLTNATMTCGVSLHELERAAAEAHQRTHIDQDRSGRWYMTERGVLCVNTSHWWRALPRDFSEGVRKALETFSHTPPYPKLASTPSPAVIQLPPVLTTVAERLAVCTYAAFCKPFRGTGRPHPKSGRTIRKVYLDMLLPEGLQGGSSAEFEEGVRQAAQRGLLKAVEVKAGSGVNIIYQPTAAGYEAAEGEWAAFPGDFRQRIEQRHQQLKLESQKWREKFRKKSSARGGVVE